MDEPRESFVILNGELTPKEDARVPVDDRGFLYGESVFTTLRCYGGAPFALERHCARLNGSLRSSVVGIDLEIDLSELRRDIAALVEHNRCPEAVVRFMVTRGRGGGPMPPKGATPTTLLTVKPHKPNPALYDPGARLVISSVRRDPDGELGKHKLGSYFPSLLARREAVGRGADEAVITDTDGRFLEGACSNLFAVQGGALVTPGDNENLLPGVTRQIALERAAALGIPVDYKKLGREDLGGVDEWFLTSAGMEIAPVAAFEETAYASPGPVTAQLMAAYRREIEADHKR